MSLTVQTQNKIQGSSEWRPERVVTVVKDLTHIRNVFGSNPGQVPGILTENFSFLVSRFNGMQAPTTAPYISPDSSAGGV
jgi:hypothetical protein